ncbi:MAG TPA: DUF433 domain-containing protein [Tepidisphaeraceae bacterium]|jgi:uncharacterized protein (DUF433 family)
MSTTHTQWQYLERDPKSSYRQLSIKGRRIKARTLYGKFMSAEEPQTIEEIAKDYSLPIEAVKEAIAYCESNPPEIRQDFLHEEMIMEAAGMNDPNYKYHGRPKPISPEERARIRRLCYPSEST